MIVFPLVLPTVNVIYLCGCTRDSFLHYRFYDDVNTICVFLLHARCPYRKRYVITEVSIEIVLRQRSHFYIIYVIITPETILLHHMCIYYTREFIITSEMPLLHSR